MEKVKISNWTIEYDGKRIPAAVPGDITIDLFRAGVIKNPYYGFNYRENDWIARRDFTYETELDVTDEILAQDSVALVFDGVDVYSDVYLNGKLLGHTENMFLQYRFEVKEYLQKGKNRLCVCMRSTLNKMDEFDTTGYCAVFNVKRLFVRKAQCHFGWDWAPKICAYGIWQDVRLEYGDACKIEDAYVVADAEGNATFFTELNYNIYSTVDGDGQDVSGSFVVEKGDTLRYALSKTPFGTDYVVKSFPVEGKKNFACFQVPNAELWWPVGYGAQPLYNYKIELERGGKVVSVKTGRVGFRSVRLLEKPKGDAFLGYELEINGKIIFVRGSNWIPVECFTGVVEDEKYERLTDLAVQANHNMLRVWGGGIYEKDIFYDLCDEKGLLVWQDIMLACGDIPEDCPDWVQNMLAEVEYQVKRLRNHPSLVYWCGGNEKTGCYGRCITRGDFFVDVLLQGLVAKLDKTRPYARQSPCSHTDVGQDGNSGESHHNSFERSILEGVRKYRSLVAEKRVPFISEAALMGPNSVETNEKIYPADKLWPMNEYWDDRLMDNPYGVLHMTFAQRQMKYATDMYGEVKNLNDFTAKGMLMHAEAMRAESEFARSGEGITSGFMAWMYGDIWPSGSWSVVDYWCEPKQAYYQMKRSFAPRLVTFVQNASGKTDLVVVNDTLEPYSTEIRYGAKRFDGEVLFERTTNVYALGEKPFFEEVAFDCDRADIYLFAEYVDGGEQRKNIYSPKMWCDASFTSDYETKIEKKDAHRVLVTIHANAFAKSVFVRLPDNYKYTYSDNYIDLEAGETRTLTITSKEEIDETAIVVTDFAKMTEGV